MKEIGRIISDPYGNELPVYRQEYNQFPDKKKVNINNDEIEKAVKLVRKIKEDAEVGQDNATWIPQLEYKNKPMLFLFMTDVHYTSIKSDHDRLNKYLDVVKETPNMFLVSGGDDIDNFNINLGKVASGVYEDPIEPGIQGKAWAKKMTELDRGGKIGFFVFGNHTDWNYQGGQDWYDTFLGQMEAPILTSGGLVKVMFHEGASYDIAATHKYWGVSKLNPTNACKRYLEHEHPTADVVLLGHTHQSEALQFDRGGKDRIGIIGGTFKTDDDYARKHGIGGRGGTPGMCVALWSDHREMQVYKNFERGVEEHIRRL